jgi:hypothetical protein
VLFDRRCNSLFCLPSLTIRAHLRNVKARSDDFVLPEIFELDATMEAALLETTGGFSDVSVLDAVCFAAAMRRSLWASHRGGAGPARLKG